MNGSPATAVTALAMLLAASWGAASPPLRAQELSWLPAPVEEGAAQQLADRLLALGDPASDTDALLAGARELIRSMRDGIDAWGADGAIAKAPAFAELAVPGADRAPLDAMGRWSICNLDLLLRYDDALRAADGGAALGPALGLSAVTLVVLRLREPFAAAGGQQSEIETHLTSAGFETLLTSIQTSPPLRERVRSGCDPLVRELLAAPIAWLREQRSREAR